MTTLVRSVNSCAAAEVPALTPHFDDLMAEAAAFLDYRMPADAQSAEATAARNVERSNEIRAALRERHDPPFDPRSVERYKKKMHWLSMPRNERLANFFIENCFGSAIVGLVISGVAALIAALISSTIAFWCGMTALAFVAFGVVGATVSYVLMPKKVLRDSTIFLETKTRWREIPIKEYHKPIPEFALQTALDLKQKFFNDIQFVIEELEVTREERVVSHDDPFLRADLSDGSRYYLEVWNEPQFRGTRIA